MAQLPDHIQKIIDAQKQAAPASAAPAAAPAAAPVAAQAAPPPFDPNVMPSLNAIPDQASRGPKYLPWKEVYDIRCTLHQIRHRAPTDRSGPRFEAIFDVTKVVKGETIMAGTPRALAWFYNPFAYGKEKDKSDRNLREFKEFIAGCMGQAGQKDFNADKAAAELIALCVKVPSLGLPLRMINVEDGTSKTTGQIFYKQTTMLATD